MSNPILYKDLVSEDVKSGFNDLIAQVGQVQQSLTNMLAAVKQEATSLGSALSATASSTKTDREAVSQYAAEVEKLHAENEKLTKSLSLVQSQLDGLKKKKDEDKPATENLASSYKSLATLIEETGVSVEALLTTEKQLTIAKNNGKTANTSLQGSYNQLYAQYNLIKNVLNAMGVEMRNNTEVGKKWEAEALRIMTTMKGMQESTGKHTLSVGDYSKALNGLSISTQQVLREMPTLANSLQQFFIAISNNVPIFVDNLKAVKEATGSWKVALKGVLTSVFSWQTALLGLLTILPKIAKSIHDKKKAQEEANKATKEAITLENLLNKAESEATQAEIKNVNELKTLYRISQDVGRSERERADALALINQKYPEASRNIDAYIERLEKEARARAYLNEIEKIAIEQYKLEGEIRTATSKLNEANTNKELANENKIIAQQRIIGENQLAYDQRNAEAVRRYNEASEAADKAKEELDALSQQYKDAGDSIDELVDRIDVGALKTSESTKNLTKEQKDYFWDWAESVANILDDEERKAILLSNITFEQKKENLQKELDEQKKAGTLSAEQESYLTDTILNLETQRAQKVLEIRNKYAEQWRKDSQKYTEVVAEETIADESSLSISSQYNALLAENSRKLLASRQSLNKAIEEDDFREAKEEGEAFKKLTKEKLRLEADYQEDLLRMRKDEGKLTQDQYDIEFAEIENKYAKSVADLEKKGRKTKFNLATLIFGRTKEVGKGNVYKEMSAETEEFVKNFESAMDTALDYMDEWMDKRIEMAEVAVEAAEKESDAAKTTLDYEMEARANGYANNVELARKEYEEKLKIEQEAIAEKERLEKIQEGIDSAQQVSSLMVATAKLIAAYAGLPFIGQALSIAAIASMWGTFAAAKITASQLTSTQYGEGMTEYLNYGGSHASGNDIDFGADKNGRRRRVERGEVIGVVNKKNVEKYGVGRVVDVIDSLNKGTFEEKYAKKTQTEALNEVIMKESLIRSIGLNRTNSVVENLSKSTFDDKYGLAFSGFADGSTDLSAVERGIRTLVEQGETRVVSIPNGRIEYRGNSKRIIHNS